jgi:hypothetical protein
MALLQTKHIADSDLPNCEGSARMEGICERGHCDFGDAQFWVQRRERTFC